MADKQSVEVGNEEQEGSIMGDLIGPAITPKTVKEVQFYGDTIIAVVMEDGSIYVPVRPIVTALGLDFSSQRRRILRDELLSEDMINVSIQQGDQMRTMLALPIEDIPIFLVGISPSKVRPELRDKIRLYQRKCQRALWDVLRYDLAPGLVAQQTVALQTTSGAEYALELGRAVVSLAEQQIAFERSLQDLLQGQADQTSRYQVMADYMRGFIERNKVRMQEYDNRIGALEMRLDPKNVITNAQATDVQLAVHFLAAAIQDRNSGVNGFSTVWFELYSTFQVPSYKSLPQNKYDDVMKWLSAWFDRVRAATPEPSTAALHDSAT